MSMNMTDLGKRARAASRIMAKAPTDKKNQRFGGTAAIFSAKDRHTDPGRQRPGCGGGKNRRPRRRPDRPADAHARPARRHRRRPAQGDRSAGPGRRTLRRIHPPERPAPLAPARPARRAGRDLRIPPERDGRRGRPRGQDRQRGDPARRQRDDPLQPGAGRMPSTRRCARPACPRMPSSSSTTRTARG